MQNASFLCFLEDILGRLCAHRIVFHIVKAEAHVLFRRKVKSRRKIARCLIQIDLEAALADTWLFNHDAGKRVYHEILRILKVMQITVQIKGQTVAVADHQLIVSRLIARQKKLIKLAVTFQA